MLPDRKRIRLDHSVYETSGQYFSITINTHNKLKLFDNAGVACLVVKLIQGSYLSQVAELSVFCLMPNHLHLLISPVSRSLVDVVQLWKSYSAKILNHELHRHGSVWQRSFFDHALRKEEDVFNVARYILENPVRKGLVKNWAEYPYSWCEWFERK